MKLALCTDVLGDLSFTDMLDKVKELGINAVEMTAGGWGGCKHVPTQELLADEDKLEKVLENPQVIRTPVVRNGKQSTLGYQPDVWKGWN